MTDESEAGRRARAPPPRPTVRPEPRPRTLPPRLIRPSEHLAMVEQARERRPPPLMPSVTVVQGPTRIQGPKHRQSLPTQSLSGYHATKSHSVTQGAMQGPHSMQGSSPQVPHAMQGTSMQVHPVIHPPPVVQGPRPPPPPPVPRPYVPPPTRMPAPMAINPVTRLPQPRRDIQTSPTTGKRNAEAGPIRNGLGKDPMWKHTYVGDTFVGKLKYGNDYQNDDIALFIESNINTERIAI
ncbi:unnamed protein product, partial [Brenthis ino]